MPLHCLVNLSCVVVAIWVCSLSVIVSWGVLMNTNYILLALGQDPLIAKYTEEYMFFFMPVIYLLFMYQLIGRYQQVQGYLIPSLVVGVIANCVAAILQYCLIYEAGMGMTGSGLASLLGYTTLGGLIILHTVASGMYKQTWGGWSRECLEDWGAYFQLGLSSVMMICLEWWTFEIGMFLMGVLGPVELGANSIMYAIWMIYSSISLGIGSACAFRIGRYLGAKDVKGAISSARVALVFAGMVSIATVVITLSLHYYLPMIFSSDPVVLELSRSMVPILALFSFFAAGKNMCAGIVRATGKQLFGGVISFIAFVVCGLPTGIPLMFLTYLGAAGFWWGQTVGMFVACICLVVLVFSADWDKEAADAQVRAKVTKGRKKSRYNTKANSEDIHLLSEGATDNGTADYGTSEKPKSVTHPPGYWRRLVILRSLTTALCIGLFAFGVVCRFVIFVPPPVPQMYNYTDNGQMIA